MGKLVGTAIAKLRDAVLFFFNAARLILSRLKR